MAYCVLTPFSRPQNVIELGDCLKRQGVQWHLLSVKGEHVLPDLGSWVHQHHFDPPPPGFFIGHWLVNQFVDNGVNDDDYYVVLTDDDFTEEGFFRKLDVCTEDIVIVSMQRSNKPTGTDAGCPFGTLIADPENLKVAYVGYEQLIIRGRVMKQYRCEAVYHADGLLIEKLWAEKMELFRFMPDAYVYFNYLPPGRTGRWDR
jgi:hypothetical protein